MSGYHLALLFAAIVAGAASYKLPRAWLYIGALAASFILSVAYLYNAPSGYTGAGIAAWYPPPSVIAGLCDVVVCVVILAKGKRLWESSLYSLMLFSVAVNMVYSFSILVKVPPVPPQETYAILLEVINYAALALIGGTGIANLVGGSNAHSPFLRGLVRGFRVARDTLQKEVPPKKTIRLW